MVVLEVIAKPGTALAVVDLDLRGRHRRERGLERFVLRGDGRTLREAETRLKTKPYALALLCDADDPDDG